MIAGVLVAGLVVMAFVSVKTALGPVHGDIQLREAIRAEDLPRVSELVADAEAAELGPGLCYATERGFMAAVSELLARGVSPDRSCGPTAGTPLHVAVAADRLDVVTVLLEAGANLDATDSAGRTALNVAHCATPPREAIAEFLRERGSAMSPPECVAPADGDTSVSALGQCTCVYNRLSPPPTSCADPRCSSGSP
jgi:hypothetical protein